MATPQRVVYYGGVPYIDNTLPTAGNGFTSDLAPRSRDLGLFGLGLPKPKLTPEQMVTQGMISPMQTPGAATRPPARPAQPLTQMPSAGWAPPGGMPGAGGSTPSFDSIINGSAPQFGSSPSPRPAGGQRQFNGAQMMQQQMAGQPLTMPPPTPMTSPPPLATPTVPTPQVGADGFPIPGATSPHLSANGSPIIPRNLGGAPFDPNSLAALLGGA